ncbi:MAG: zinc ribbon domain-containing protein [Candidatus Micrarchaeota archaeon]|nr:zinc ribbon domain-containing protein [Candidatus Micrarchaeota archaeon]
MGILDFLSSLFSKKSSYQNIILKCPNCKKEFDISLERCPHCGVHTELLFRIKCPFCGEPNNLKNQKCSKCKKPLTKEQGDFSSVYICPICNYRANFFMTSCPSCGTKFI